MVVVSGACHLVATGGFIADSRLARQPWREVPVSFQNSRPSRAQPLMVYTRSSERQDRVSMHFLRLLSTVAVMVSYACKVRRWWGGCCALIDMPAAPSTSMERSYLDSPSLRYMQPVDTGMYNSRSESSVGILRKHKRLLKPPNYDIALQPDLFELL